MTSNKTRVFTEDDSPEVIMQKMSKAHFYSLMNNF